MQNMYQITRFRKKITIHNRNSTLLENDCKQIKTKTKEIIVLALVLYENALKN